MNFTQASKMKFSQTLRPNESPYNDTKFINRFESTVPIELISSLSPHKTFVPKQQTLTTQLSALKSQETIYSSTIKSKIVQPNISP